MKSISQHIKLYLFLYIFVIFVFILRLAFTIDFLEDWDSVQFALALHDYSIVSHQPHPPGYPIYILLGRFINIFFSNDIKTLTFISALFSSLSIIPLFFLAKKIFNQTTAILTISFFVFIPLVWILSEVALTDIPGLFFIITVAYLIYITKNNNTNFILVSLLSGLILGFRTNNISIIISLLFLVWLHRRDIKLALLSFTFFLCGIAIWLIPLIIITGLNQFLFSYSVITKYVIWHDIFLGNNLGIKSIVKIKLEQFWYLLKISYSPLFSLISLITFIYIYAQRKKWRLFEYQFLGIWIIAQLIPQFTVFNLEMPRHLLPLFPPLLILISSIFAKIIKRNFIFLFLVFLIIITLFSQSWSQTSRLRKQNSPSIQPIKFVKQNFNPQNTIIISSLTYRHFQYYAAEYKIYQSSQISQIKAPLEKVIVIDNFQLQDKIKNLNDFIITDDLEFIGDKDIYPRVSKTNLYILRYQKNETK